MLTAARTPPQVTSTTVGASRLHGSARKRCVAAWTLRPTTTAPMPSWMMPPCAATVGATTRLPPTTSRGRRITTAVVPMSASAALIRTQPITTPPSLSRARGRSHRPRHRFRGRLRGRHRRRARGRRPAHLPSHRPCQAPHLRRYVRRRLRHRPFHRPFRPHRSPHRYEAGELARSIAHAYKDVVLRPYRGAQAQGALGFGKGLLSFGFGFLAMPVRRRWPLMATDDH